ncbi:protocatechuate 3,4-dioxygenase subunit alpha [Phaeobacter sp.]|uniref:protocatechuate 3,4-dioxygenase subunit alpha n=1 Tax=Phaeobacter sp. TaxID=1902409 RepID=UPI0025E78F51|nr:protocatechuate 3,4-dioxygenase subunit alpha [Phaeobacter sp.]
MAKTTELLSETASQTAGPYVHIGLSPNAAGFDIYDKELGADIAGPNAKGQRIRVEGTVWDGQGESVKDVLIEIWQPNSDGNFAHSDAVEDAFRGWGRVISDFDTGAWGFDTVRPGASGQEAPHLNLWIVARGINVGLHTRMYFPDDSDAHLTDPVLNNLDHDQRATLVAAGDATSDLATYRFDIRLQGDAETVFFDI